MNIEIESSLHWVRAISDWGMAILIWVVQFYVYPSFREVKAGLLVDWHKGYMNRIAWMVGPLMIGQLAAGAGLLLTDASMPSIIYAALVGATWILTGLVATPLHRNLQDLGKDSRTISGLIAWNWPRTVLWTAIIFV